VLFSQKKFIGYFRIRNDEKHANPFLTVVPEMTRVTEFRHVSVRAGSHFSRFPTTAISLSLERWNKKKDGKNLQIIYNEYKAL